MTKGFLLGVKLLHQLNDRHLSSIAAANAGADDAGIAAIALGIAGSNLLEQLLAHILAGDEAHAADRQPDRSSCRE